MEQLNFFNFPISVPSNVYGFAHLKGERSRVLVATLEKQIFCIEYSDGQFSCNEVHFTYIPNGADIISIDAFQRASTFDTVVGITFFKSSSKESEASELRKNAISQSSNRSLSSAERNQLSNQYYFNIYSSTNKFDLNQIAQDLSRSFELEFVPFHLYHTTLHFLDQPSEIVFLLSGSDCCVHIYREDVSNQCFSEEKINLFPELTNLRSIALWIDVLNLVDSSSNDHQAGGGSAAHCRRLTAIGAEDGWVELFLSEYDDPATPVPIRSFKHQFDGPVLSVRLFRDQSSNQLERSLKERLHLQGVAPYPTESIHLLVANSYEAPVVYRNVLHGGMTVRKNIPIANQMDILLATFVADINFDGQNEILLGKYSKDFLAYQYDAKAEEYVLVNRMKFANPLHVIAYLDLTGNGIKELVIITTKGVTIHRHKFSDVVRILEEKVGLCLQLSDR